MSASFQQKFNTQQQEIQDLSNVVLEMQKSMKENAGHFAQYPHRNGQPGGSCKGTPSRNDAL